MTFAKIRLFGNAGRDPELRYTTSGTPVCQFSVATNSRQKKNGEVSEQTTWYRATGFGRQAELLAEFVKKGSPIYIEGDLAMDTYTARDGSLKNSLEVTIRDFHLPPRVGAGENAQLTPDTAVEEIPF